MEDERMPQYDTFDIEMSRIYYDDTFNCRGAFTASSIEELAKSIQFRGLDFPVVVRPAKDVPYGVPHGYRYHLIAGHRRFKAFQYLNRKSIPAMVREGLAEHDARVLNLSENIERQDLNPLEEALAIKAIYKDLISVAEIARELKRTAAWVQVRLDVLKLPEEVQGFVAARMLGLTYVRAILTLNPEQQATAARRLMAGDKSGPFSKDRFKKRVSRERITRMISYLFDHKLDGLPTRLLAWVLTGISDEELMVDIQAELERRKKCISYSCGCGSRRSPRSTPTLP